MINDLNLVLDFVYGMVNKLLIQIQQTPAQHNVMNIHSKINKLYLNLINLNQINVILFVYAVKYYFNVINLNMINVFQTLIMSHGHKNMTSKKFSTVHTAIKILKTYLFLIYKHIYF